MIEIKHYVTEHGGYVHPDLELLVGDEAKHGKLSLSGVPDEQVSVILPIELLETTKRPGIWMAFLASLGYDPMADETVKQHCLGNSYMPIIGAANHKRDSGQLIDLAQRVILQGTTFTYSESEEQLKNIWGIYE